MSIITKILESERDVKHICDGGRFDHYTLRQMNNSDGDWSKYRCRSCNLKIYDYITRLYKTQQLHKEFVNF
jgi:hypothetical protein